MGELEVGVGKYVCVWCTDGAFFSSVFLSSFFAVMTEVVLYIRGMYVGNKGNRLPFLCCEQTYKIATPLLSLDLNKTGMKIKTFLVQPEHIWGSGRRSLSTKDEIIYSDSHHPTGHNRRIEFFTIALTPGQPSYKVNELYVFRTQVCCSVGGEVIYNAIIL